MFREAGPVGKTFGIFLALALLPSLVAQPAKQQGRQDLVVAPDVVHFTKSGAETNLTRTVNVRRPGKPSSGADTFSAAVTLGSEWLSVTPSQAQAPATLTLTARPGTLAAGTHAGRVTITPSRQGSVPQAIEVRLRILTGPDGRAALLVRPDSLSFRMRQGGPNPEPRTLNISSPTATTAYNWSANVLTASPWLQLSSSTGTGNGLVTVSVAGTALPVGTYNGTVRVVSGQAQVQVPVTLEILPQQGAGGAQTKLVVAPRAYNFIVRPGAPAPAPKTLNVKTAAASEVWNAKAVSQGNWLSITPATGTGDGSIQLSVNPSQSRGHYEGSVEVTAGGQTESVRVFLRVVGPPGGEPARPQRPSAVTIVPAAIYFETAPAAVAPNAIQLRLLSSTPGLTYNAVATTFSGGNWFSVSPAAGNLPATLQVTPAAVPSLAPGVYNGSITITVAGSIAEQRVVPVALRVGNVGESPRLTVRPGAVTMRTTAGGPIQTSQVRLEPRGVASLPYQSTVSTISGSSWLSVSPAAGTAPQTLTVSANPAGLAAGSYRGSVLFQATGGTGAAPVALQVVLTIPAAAGASISSIQGVFLTPAAEFAGPANAPLNIEVKVIGPDAGPLEGGRVRVASSGDEPDTELEEVGEGVYAGRFVGWSGGSVALTAVASREGLGTAEFAIGGDLESSDAPVIYPRGIVNAGSFSSGESPLAPGSIVSLFGRGLADETQVAETTPLPLELSGVRVFVGGIPAPLFAVISSADGTEDQINFQMPPETAGLTYADIVVVKNSSPSAPEGVNLAPAVPGLFASTSGDRAYAAALDAGYALIAANNPARRGDVILLFGTGLGAVAASAGGIARTIGDVRVTIDGQDAEVTYAGFAPGFVGLYQLNVKLAQGLAPGDASVEITVDGIGTGQSLFIPVR